MTLTPFFATSSTAVAGGVAVLCHHDDDLRALGDHVLDLVVLELGIMVGFLERELRNRHP